MPRVRRHNRTLTASVMPKAPNGMVEVQTCDIGARCPECGEHAGGETCSGKHWMTSAKKERFESGDDPDFSYVEATGYEEPMGDEQE